MTSAFLSNFFFLLHRWKDNGEKIHSVFGHKENKFFRLLMPSAHGPIFCRKELREKVGSKV